MQLYGIVGDPVEHSLSPAMHEASYDALDIDASYVRFHVDSEDVEEAVTGARALGVNGFNVTVPHKQAVAEHPALALDDTARAIGAVNTVDLGSMKAYNTDAAGVSRALEHHDVDVSGSRAVVVGAGGAARAVVYELDRLGADVAVANRTEERAHALAEEFDVEGHGLEALSELLPSTDLLVNATTVGMEEDRSPVAADLLHSGLTVFDAVYTPLRTRLLREAEEAGADTVDGAWMLVYQGVEAFEIWTGREAPVEVMNEALRRELR